MIHEHRCNGQGHGLSPGTGIVAAAVFVVAISSASAQSLHETDVSAGYLTLGGSMHGGSIQLTVPVTERWNIVGEFDASRGRDCSGCEPAYRDFAGLGGVR